jgi:hypothetical protein
MKDIGPELNFGLRPGALFPAKVVDWIREHAGGKNGLGAERQQESLGSLAAHIATGKDDPRLFLMSLAAKFAPGMGAWRTGGEPWLTTITQRNILNALGGYGAGAPMGSDDVLTRLASAGVNDVLREISSALSDARRRQQQAEDEMGRLAQKVTPLEETEAELDAERRRADRLAGDIETLRAEISNMRSFITDKGGMKRRVPIGGGPQNVGLFHALLDGRLIYEVAFTDDKGAKRWRRLKHGATIEDARRLRAGLQGKPCGPDDAADDDQQTNQPEAEPVAALEERT